MTRNAFLLACLCAALLTSACEPRATAPAATADSTRVDSAAAAPAPEVAARQVPDSTALMALAKEVLQAAVDKDYAALASHIHPGKGLRFSPYAYIDVKEDKVFQAKALQDQAAQAKQKVHWGTYDPSGEPIHSTLDGYFKEFVTDKPYLSEGRWAYNQTIGSSTVINNLEEVYPHAQFVETHWAPQDEEMAPFQWGSVRFVFEQLDGVWYLVGLVHDAWNT